MKRIIGEISKEDIINYKLEEHKNKKVVLYDTNRKHCKKKHLKNYDSPADFHLVMNSLEEMIKFPEYISYDPENRRIEFFKKVKYYIILIGIEYLPKDRELKIKSVYPVKEKTINKRKNKSN